jgi:two-component system, sensor histidine kinase RegB
VSYIDNKTVYQLIWIRGISVFMQMATLAVAEISLGISLPLSKMLLIITVYFIFHIITWYRYQTHHNLTKFTLFIYLSIDVLVLCALLYHAGGATNPFISLLLFPLTITATILNSRYTWLMAFFSIVSYSLLMQFHISLPHNHAAGNEFSLHVFGMWFGFVLSAALVSFFIVSLRKTIKVKEQQLHDAHEQVLKDRQLLSLATLSASTAHELGTPLGTISLLSDELDAEITQTHIKEELIFPLKQQVKRCKKILSVLSASTGNLHLDGGQKLAVDQFIKKLVHDWQDSHLESQISIQYNGLQPAPEILAEQVLRQAIVNILDNALRESQQPIECLLNWDKKRISLTINDYGPGLTKELLDKMGKKPLLNSRDGMGLGLFLSHTIIERIGGKISFSNRKPQGLSTQILFPINF